MLIIYSMGGQIFSTESHIKNFIATRGRIHYIYKRFKKTWTFYISWHKMKVTVVTSGWVKMEFHMKQVK